MTDVEKFCVQCLSCNVANQMTKPQWQEKKSSKKTEVSQFLGEVRARDGRHLVLTCVGHGWATYMGRSIHLCVRRKLCIFFSWDDFVHVTWHG